METQDSADLSMKPTFAISPECEIPGVKFGVLC